MVIITIGRHYNNDIIINDSTVSHQHVQLVHHDDGHYSICDLNSKNGTYVNGKRISGKVSLKKGDKVQIGKTILPWTTYLSSKRSHVPSPKRHTLPVKLGGISCVFFVVLLIIAFLFVGKDDSFRYDKDNIKTQVLVLFSEDVSYRDACSLLNKHRAQILDSNASYGYFLVYGQSELDAESLVAELDTSYMIDCVIRNQYLSSQSTKLSVLDVFGEPMSESETLSYGQMVSKTMTEGTLLSVNQFEVKKENRISTAEMTRHFFNLCEQMLRSCFENIMEFGKSLGLNNKRKDLRNIMSRN